MVEDALETWVEHHLGDVDRDGEQRGFLLRRGGHEILSSLSGEAKRFNELVNETGVSRGTVTPGWMRRRSWASSTRP